MRATAISRRIVGQVLIDLVLIGAAHVAALTLTRGAAETPPRFLLALPLLAAFRLAALGLFHLYRIRWRYMSLYDLNSVVAATALSSVVFALALLLVGGGRPGPYSAEMQVVDGLLNLLLLSGVRVGYRQLSDRSLLGGEAPHRRQRALIVGAGDAGEMIARELLRRPQEGVIPIGFVDDDPQKRKLRIHGLPVLGGTRDTAALVDKIGAHIILIAIPSASGKTVRDIVARCEAARARLCIVPSLPDVLSGRPRLGPMRDINIEDLLRRPPVRIDQREIAGYLSGQRVLVTGAGGSIGAELCRQIAALNPARLLLLGRGENSIFEIEQELIREFGIAPIALIGDVRDRDRVEEIFLQERPTVVFHAAAHKHVPLMEANPAEAVKNNVLGTRNLAEIAAACGVKKFIYVSTDKAVNPTSVMGATKRLGELIVQSLAKTTATEFAAVRFGNVLGSRGSVIPIMRKQIARGGPVTVTDAHMTRYFMTIPEAAQLILQAGALGRRGEIFLLDMGEPVRILDLARDLIRLSGLRPEIDIKIEFTGVRPGEKIEEELVYSQEEVERTAHEKIYVCSRNASNPAVVLRSVDRLIRRALEGERDSLRDEIVSLATQGFETAETVLAAPPREAEVPLPGVPAS